MNKMRELKIRYLDILQTEGCLNEVLFDKSEWDDDEDRDIDYYGEDRFLEIVPDDVVFHQFGDYVLMEDEGEVAS